MSSNIIKIKAGSGTPTTSDIQDRELAFDRSADKLYINDAGTIVDLNTTGDIEGVTAGTGLSGGGTSGTVNLDIDLTEVGFGGGANRLITDDGDGTVSTESNLTFDGDFKVTGTLSSLETINFDQASGDTVVKISGTGNQRLEFADTATGANAWIGIPSWNDDAFYLFGPTSTGNEQAWVYESSTHRFFTGSSEQLAIYSNGAIDMSGYSVADRHLEIGSNRQVNGYAYIDLIGDTTYTDFGARFIRENGGPNTGTAIEHRGTGVLSLNAKDAGSVRFYTSNTERVRIDSSGNVSIGNISASRPLQIGFTTTNGEAIKLDGNASYGASIYYSRGGSYNWNAGVGGASSSSSNIPASYWGVEDVSQGNAVRLAIAHTTGNVGIGTNSPTQKLEVNGSIRISSDNQKLIIGANSDLELYAHDPAGDSRINVNNNPLLLTYNGTDRFRMNSTSLIINEGGGDYNFKVEGDNDASLFFVDAGTDRVGIGTTSPSEKLQVNSTATYDTKIKIGDSGTSRYFLAGMLDANTGMIGYVNGTPSHLAFHTGTGATGSEKMRIETGGNVGIGTNSPNAKFEVSGSTNSDLFSLEGAGSSFKLIAESGSTGSADIMVYRLGLRYGSNDNGFIDFYRGPDGATGYLAFGASGSEAMRLDRFGKLGIGTNSPSHEMVLRKDQAAETEFSIVNLTSNASAATNLRFRNATSGSETGNGGLIQLANGNAFKIINQFGNPLIFGTSNAEKMRIDSSGNVGIGTQSPSFKLKVNVTQGTYTFWETIAGFQAKRSADSETEAGIMINSLGDGLGGQISSNWYWSNNTGTRGNTGRSAGIFGITNQTTTNSEFYWQTTPHNSNTVTTRMELDGATSTLHVDGDVVAYSTTVSDKRLKDNVETIDNALSKVMKLRGVEFDWIGASRKGQHDIGLIAQEVEEVLPEVVREKEFKVGEFTDNKQTFKTVDYDKMVGVLIEAIKEQQQQINELKEKLNG